MKKIAVPILVVLLIASAIGNYLLYSRYSSSRVLFVVGDDKITKKDLNDRVDNLYARGILQKLIWSSMVMQEAKRKNCAPTEADVDQALDDTRRMQPFLISNIQAVDPNLSFFREDVRNNLALRNIQISGISVTKAEVERYYRDHSSDFRAPSRIKTTMVTASDDQGRLLAQSLLESGVEDDVISERPELNVIADTVKFSQTLPAQMANSIASQPLNEVRSYNITGGYLIVKSYGNKVKSAPKLSQIYDKVERAAKMAKAPSQDSILQDIRRRITIVSEGKYDDAIPAIQ
jgi:hypothetical protein